MPEHASHNGSRGKPELYPPLEPYDQRMMEMPGNHSIYVEQCGNPLGVPVVVLHGGPGGGCSPSMRRFFDPTYYRVILFDQRGCGRSKPNASVENNTTWDLVADIELIRETLGIDKWIVFGGSWGAALALIYAQKHPEHAARLVLRGVFLMSQEELDWFYGGGAARFWPKEWKAFEEMIPPSERGDLIKAYEARLFDTDLAVQTKFAKAWAGWESALAALEPKGHGGPSGAYARAFSRLENHYFANKGFLNEDQQILSNMDKLEKVPGHIVQGRYDMICPPHHAQKLHDLWPRSTIKILPRDGHALSEPGIASELLNHMNGLRGVGV